MPEPLRIRVNKLFLEVASVLPLVGNYVRRHERWRAAIGAEPGQFYSPIPDYADVAAREAELLPAKPSPRIAGVDLNESGQLERLTRLEELYRDQPFTPESKPGNRYHLNNGFFAFSDGIFMHCMIRDARPRRIIEIGCGWSSALILDTNEQFLANDIHCTFIDPDMSRLRELKKPTDNIQMIEKRLHLVRPEIFKELTAGDILSVDTSHVTKIGSELNNIFFDIFPLLAKGVLIHIHDIFYPFEYPKDYQWAAFNEIYLLRAFLQFNSAFRIAMFPGWVETFHRERLRQRMPYTIEHPPYKIRGASIWLERID